MVAALQSHVVPDTIDEHPARSQPRQPWSHQARSHGAGHLDEVGGPGAAPHLRSVAPLPSAPGGDVAPPPLLAWRELPIVGLAVVAAVLFGVLLAVRTVGGQPPAGSWAELENDSRVPATASVGPGDHVRVAQPGDTFWALASELVPGEDPRPVVDVLVEANGGSAIEVGQRLIIPAALIEQRPLPTHS